MYGIWNTVNKHHSVEGMCECVGCSTAHHSVSLVLRFIFVSGGRGSAREAECVPGDLCCSLSHDSHARETTDYASLTSMHGFIEPANGQLIGHASNNVSRSTARPINRRTEDGENVRDEQGEDERHGERAWGGGKFRLKHTQKTTSVFTKSLTELPISHCFTQRCR